MSIPIVAIVGRPNVGKSTLFNRLIGHRKAIIDDLPGVTRDRNYSVCTWGEKQFLLIDTGGLDTETERPINAGVHEQALMAIEEADIIIFLMDIRDGLLPSDKDIDLILKRSNKPSIYVVNKADNERIASHLFDFYSLGADTILPVSASHGTGIDDLMEHVTGFLPSRSESESDGMTRLAIIGRPNVGKSSLLNKILRKERSLVSEEPGTTVIA